MREQTEEAHIEPQEKGVTHPAMPLEVTDPGFQRKSQEALEAAGQSQRKTHARSKGE